VFYEQINDDDDERYDSTEASGNDGLTNVTNTTVKMKRHGCPAIHVEMIDWRESTSTAQTLPG